MVPGYRGYSGGMWGVSMGSGIAWVFSSSVFHCGAGNSYGSSRSELWRAVETDAMRARLGWSAWAWAWLKEM